MVASAFMDDGGERRTKVIIIFSSSQEKIWENLRTLFSVSDGVSRGTQWCQQKIADVTFQV